MTLPKSLAIGTHTLTAVFVPSASGVEGSTSNPVTVRVSKNGK